MANSLEPTSRRTRRFYSAEFKSQVIQDCRMEDASIASTAMRYQVNVNIIHRWLREHDQRGLHCTPAFMPLAVENCAAPTMPTQSVPVSQNRHPTSPSDVSEVAKILVEVRRGHQLVSIHWPAQTATSCAAWLIEWLK